MQQSELEEKTRADGQSGLKRIRLQQIGAKPYETATIVETTRVSTGGCRPVLWLGRHNRVIKLAKQTSCLLVLCQAESSVTFWKDILDFPKLKESMSVDDWLSVFRIQCVGWWQNLLTPDNLVSSS